MRPTLNMFNAMQTDSMTASVGFFTSLQHEYENIVKRCNEFSNGVSRSITFYIIFVNFLHLSCALIDLEIIVSVLIEWNSVYIYRYAELYGMCFNEKGRLFSLETMAQNFSPEKI